MFKTTKAKVISVIIFSVICILTTTMLIIYKNINIENRNEEQINENKQIQEIPSTMGINLKGTYNQNDVKFESKRYARENVEIEYVQMRGLKDKIIQDNINKEIERYALNCYKTKIKDLAEIENISISIYNTANFANTASLYLSYYAKKIGSNDEYYHDEFGINYNLITGEKVKLNEMFTENAPIENILRNTTYYSIVKENTDSNLAGELIVTDYGEIEDEILEVINAYRKGKLTEFYYTPRYINIIDNKERTIVIDMMDWAEYIAIYNRFQTRETIYETNNMGYKNLYTLTDRYKDEYYYSNYIKSSNYLVDISFNVDDAENMTDFKKKIIDEKIKLVEREIEKVKAYADKNTNNFYILNYVMYVSDYEEQETGTKLVSYYERGNSYEMTIHDFEENIEPQLIEFSRMEVNDGPMPDYIYDFSDILKVEPQELTEYYNPETGEKIVI